MDAAFKKRLREKGRLLDPVVRIGKNGVTETMQEHVKKLLKKRKLIKVKLLKSFAKDRKKAVSELAEQTGAEVIEAVGIVAVLYKR